MTKVKICGITNLDDALLAARLGADMLGFNFYQNSPRFIDPQSAALIGKAVNSKVKKIGVFVNEDAARVREIAETAGLDAVQLHGDESPEYVTELAGITVIKAFRLGGGFYPALIDEFAVDSILVDAYCAGEFGGTGKICDWIAAKGIRSRSSKMFLSGGLSADNIVDAIRAVAPYAVDACSQLEAIKGKKDPAKLERFIALAKQAR